MSPAEPLGLTPKPTALKISVTIVAKTRLKALFDMTNPPLLSWRPDVVERTDAKASTLGLVGGTSHSIGQLWESKVPAPAPEISLFLLPGEWPVNARRASFSEITERVVPAGGEKTSRNQDSQAMPWMPHTAGKDSGESRRSKRCSSS